MRAGRLDGADQFVELELHDARVTVLRVLDEENDEKSGYRGSGVNNELPSVGIMIIRAGRGPQNGNDQARKKRASRSNHVRRNACELSKHCAYRLLKRERQRT